MAAVFRVDMEQQGYQSRSGRLSREPGCCQHTAGASASLGRCGGDQDAVVGRLEQAESEAAEQESPDDVGDVGLLGQKSQQNHARRHDKQSYAAHGSCVDPFDQQAGDRSHDHNDSGPGSEDQARMYFCISECLLQVEGKRDHSEHLGDERADRGDDRNGEDRDAQQVEGEDRIGFVELAAHEQCADEDQQDDAKSTFHVDIPLQYLLPSLALIALLIAWHLWQRHERRRRQSGSAKVASGDSDSADIEPDGDLPPQPDSTNNQSHSSRRKGPGRHVRPA